MIDRLEEEYKEAIEDITEINATYSGTVATATASALTDTGIVGSYDYCIITFTSGTLKDEWRVINNTGTGSLAWRHAFPAAPKAGDTYTITNPLYNATLVLRQVAMPESSDLPAVYVSTVRGIRFNQVGIGNRQGRGEMDVTLRTDVIYPFSIKAQESTRLTSDKAFWQIVTMLMTEGTFGCVASIDLPSGSQELSSLGELDGSKQCWWSVINASFRMLV